MMTLCSDKSAGSVGMSLRVLTACAPPASEAFDHIFRMSLNLHGLEEVMPVLKKSHPSGPKDYASMGLTSHIMKTLDKLILDKLQATVTDPLQFAYQ